MRLTVFALLVVPFAAQAHIKLTAPPSFQQTNTLGDPQKTGPCGGAGTATNAITTVTAGQKLKVQWNDTVGHPGHYRISISPMTSAFIDPVTVIQQNDCKSAAIQNPAMAPTVMDGVLVHTNSPTGPREQEITVPNTPCNDCMLQLLQFMSSHAPPCFYYQCARLKIVAADAGSPVLDAGTDAGTSDAGQGGGSAGGGSAGGGSAGGGSAGGGSAGGGSEAAGGGTHSHGGGSVADAGSTGGGSGAGGGNEPPAGCGCNSGVGALGLLSGFSLLLLRRRRG